MTLQGSTCEVQVSKHPRPPLAARSVAQPAATFPATTSSRPPGALSAGVIFHETAVHEAAASDSKAVVR